MRSRVARTALFLALVLALLIADVRVTEDVTPMGAERVVIVDSADGRHTVEMGPGITSPVLVTEGPGGSYRTPES